MAASLGYKNPRGARSISKFTPFNNGMYYTDYIVPDGYAKTLVNYNVDATGNSIGTRPGRTLRDHVFQEYSDIPGDLPGESWITQGDKGPALLSDYLYVHKNDGETVSGLYDCVMSFGTLGNLTDVIPSALIPQLNRVAYIFDYSKETRNNGTLEGPITYAKQGWGVLQDPQTPHTPFKTIRPANTVPSGTTRLGAITANALSNSVIFDLDPIQALHGVPVYTTFENEIYCFSAPHVMYTDSITGTDTIDVTNPRFEMSKLVIRETDTGHEVYRKTVPAKVPTVSEAQSVGFNMLSDTPYAFNNIQGGTNILGLIPYETNATGAKPVFSPNIGQSVWFRTYVSFESGSTYEWKWEYKEASATTWTALTSAFESVGTITTTSNIGRHITPNHNRFELRVTLRKTGQAATEVVFPSLVFDTTDDKLKNMKVENYNLNTAKGMFTWKNIIGLYGVQGAESTVFFSDVADPSYFPFPNSTETFNTEILSVDVYLDMIIITTVDGIHIIEGGPIAATMVTKQVLANTYITALDAQNITVLKDQIFLKTNNQFYVLKPNTYSSDGTDLKNYLNSTPINDLLFNFKHGMLKIMNDVYLEKLLEFTRANRKAYKITDLRAINLSSQIIDEEVHYTIRVEALMTEGSLGECYIDLIYEPITRAWRFHLYGIDQNGEVGSSALRHRDKDTNRYYTFHPYNQYAQDRKYSGVLICQDDADSLSDNVKYMRENVDTHTEVEYQLYTDMENNQFFETGHVSLDDTLMKRFRELQFTINNTSLERIRYYNTLLIDGVAMIDPVDYTVAHITDINDPEYGKIFVEPNIDYNMSVAGDTKLDQIPDDPSTRYWEVDLSAFPDLDLATVRLTLYGKGRRGSMKCLSTSLKKYEISNLSWVTRSMNAR